MSPMDATADHSPRTVLLRGLRGRCPCCGQGKLLRRYLSAHPACPACAEDFERLRADDGPAWLTILIIGHISIPLILSLFQAGLLENNWMLPLVIVMTTIATLALLPLCKGLFMAVLWLSKKP